MATTLLDLLAKLRLDSSDYERGLGEAEGKASGFGKVMGTVGKVGAAAFAAVGAAAIAVGKQSLESYADFEQLSGGIETLYKDAQGGTQAVEKMMKNASNAWKTAGMSANDYMEMAIESSASLINSLGGDVDKASDLMDQAIVDMSDNVNKMGTTMEAVQNAYRGFSRGNFTMLDNLALGFAGTKEGMQQLLDKAEELAGVHFDISSYSDIIEAIHVVQDEMGITGTTATEAAETISGSINAMKGAWQNMLTAIADENADFDTKVDEFVESVVQVAENIIPRIEVILQGLAKLIVEAADKLLPIVVDTIIQNLPALVEAGVKLIVALTTGLMEALPQLVAAIPDIISAIVNGLEAGWPDIKKAGGDMIEGLLLLLAEATFDFWAEMDNLLGGAMTRFDKASAEFNQKTVKAFGSIAQTIDGFNVNVADGFANFLDNADAVLTEFFRDGASDVMRWLDARVYDVYRAKDYIETHVSHLFNNVKAITKTFFDYMYDITIGRIEKIIEGIKTKFGQMKDGFANWISEAKGWGRDMVLNFTDGMREKAPWLMNIMDKLAGGISDLLGHSHPKKGPLADDYKWMPDMMELFAKGIKDNEHLVTDQIEKSFDFGGGLMGSTTPALAAGPTTNTWNITVNGIEELDEIVHWYQGRQVAERMM